MPAAPRFASLLTALALLLPVATAAQPLPVGDPEELGFSAERLATMDATLERFVTEGQHAGVLWLVARRGRIVGTGAHGLRDIEKGLPMEEDTIVRIYSMSKIVTSVAALILFEEGRFDLDDPVSEFLPELESMQVKTGGTADRPVLATAREPITINHLFTHTAGFYYDFVDDPVLAELARRAKLFEATDLEAFVKEAAKLPLGHQPGEAWTYGINTSILGRVVEVVSGQRFGEFLRTRIFEPLEMPDTGFSVPADKRDRLAKVYNLQDGTLVPAEQILSVAPGESPELGGAGLFSTIGDYARFAQKLLNGGQLDGTRVLGRKTVEFMRTNRLAHLDPPHIGSPAQGFGLGVSVVIDVGQSPAPTSLGRFGWSGAATTDCGIDPQEEIVALVFAQHFPFNEHRLFERFTTGYMQALVD